MSLITFVVTASGCGSEKVTARQEPFVIEDGVYESRGSEVPPAQRKLVPWWSQPEAKRLLLDRRGGQVTVGWTEGGRRIVETYRITRVELGR